jgi:hypothetical protein
MQIGRLDIGLWKYPPNSPWKWYQRWFEISYDKGLCGCHLFTVGRICVTWMGDECYNNPPENWEK